MMGCLIKRGKSSVWYAKIRINGTQKLVRLGVMAKHEAERALRKKIDDIERNFGRDIQKITFKELADKWLGCQKMDKKPNTVTSYSIQTLTHLVPFFGDMLVSKILPEDIDRFKQETKNNVSATTVNYDLRLLRSILDTGIRWGYLYNNPAKLTKRMKQDRKQFKALSKEEIEHFLQVLEGQGKVIIMTAIMTGMRMGEILAMKWKNLEWEHQIYTVKESYSSFGFDLPKTASSQRTVILSPMLLQMLKEHKLWQNSHRLRSGSLWEDNGLIFASENGTPINPSNLRNRIYYPALEKAGLSKSLRFHDLRGTYATIALESGADIKFVQEQLGHKTARMTLEIYAKVNPATRKVAAQKLEAYLFGS